MAKAKPPPRLNNTEDNMETSKRVAMWLKELDINSVDDGVIEYKNRQRDKYEPTTPSRQLSLPGSLHEISPTDTSCSGYSIFEAPLATAQPLKTIDLAEKALGSESDATSIDNDQSNHIQKLASVTSDNPPSECESVLPSPPQSLVTAQDPFKPRMIWLTSCLQCTLAGLPCSKAVPACSRCKRNGHASNCLLQRRWFAEDIARAPTTNIGFPVLLRLPTDSNETWQRKSSLAKELLEAWEAEQQKKNWVLPSIDSARGHYPICRSSLKQKHPQLPGPFWSCFKETFKYTLLKVHS